MRRPGVKVLAGALLASGFVLAFVFSGRRDTRIYSMRLSDAVARGPSKDAMRVTGSLRKGSLCWIAEPCEFRFVLEEPQPRDGGPPQALSVSYPRCIVPDTLGYEAPDFELETTVEGTLVAPGKFVATLILMKCPSKYRPPTDAGARTRRPPIPACR